MQKLLALFMVLLLPRLPLAFAKGPHCLKKDNDRSFAIGQVDKALLKADLTYNDGSSPFVVELSPEEQKIFKGIRVSIERSFGFTKWGVSHECNLDKTAIRISISAKPELSGFISVFYYGDPPKLPKIQKPEKPSPSKEPEKPKKKVPAKASAPEKKASKEDGRNCLKVNDRGIEVGTTTGKSCKEKRQIRGDGNYELQFLLNEQETKKYSGFKISFVNFRLPQYVLFGGLCTNDPIRRPRGVSVMGSAAIYDSFTIELCI